MVSHDRPRVTCSCCQGTGKVLLPASLFQALRLMRRRGTLSAPELAAHSTENKSLTFANNRLEKLRALGLAFRAKSAEPGRGRRAFRYYEARHGIAVQSLKGYR